MTGARRHGPTNGPEEVRRHTKELKGTHRYAQELEEAGHHKDMEQAEIGPHLHPPKLK